MNISQAQEAKVNKKITEQIEQLSTALVGVDPKLALTQDQKDKIAVLFQKRNDDIKALDSQTLSEDDKKLKIKEIRKNVTAELNAKILTKEQKKAKASLNKKE
jgi:hypothetical protein